jgi:predicted nucleic acid-binding protein
MSKVTLEQVIEEVKLLTPEEQRQLREALDKEARTAVHRKVSLADCCAIALTNRVGGTLLTSDHHELDPIASLGVCSITFIR